VDTGGGLLPILRLLALDSDVDIAVGVDIGVVGVRALRVNTEPAIGKGCVLGDRFSDHPLRPLLFVLLG
jgi:hypothetical protein